MTNKQFHKKNRFKPDKFISSQSLTHPIAVKINEISRNYIGKVVSITGIIDSISQTDGPTLLPVDDGTGTLTLKGFIGPGERAFPEINSEDSVEAKVKIKDYMGSFEGEIIKIHKLEGENAKKIIKEIEEIQRKRAMPEDTHFLVKSHVLDKLKESMIKAATEIKLAIIQNRPIIVRHHNDVDGYSAGFALERAIIPLIAQQHSSAKAAWEYYTRAPCSAPFYEIDDSIKDTATSLRNVAKFSNKMPLVVITDNGSSEQDLFGIQQGNVHGMKFIVVDHHYFEKDVISKEVVAHINPFLVGENGSSYSAGMLATELARIINSNVGNISQIPAMAGIADRVDNKKTMEDYINIAEKEGYSKKLLTDIATVIDFVSAKLRFMEAREYIEVLFGEPRDKQRHLVNLMAPYIRDLERKGLEMARMGAKIETINSISLQTISIEETFPGFGFYPKPGKCIGFVHDDLQERKGLKRLISAGIMNSAATIRATDEANFSIHDMINYIKKNLPESFVDGGGHKNAGSINFIPSKKEEVINLMKEFIQSIK